MTRVDELSRILAQRIPLALAEPWDNVGLLCGDPEATVTGMLVTVDFHEAIALEAVHAGCNYVLAYHPPLFKPASRLGPKDLVWSALSRGLAVWSPHTAFDAVAHGTNDHIAQRLGLQHVRPVKPRSDDPALGQGRMGAYAQGAEVLLSEVKAALGVERLLVAGELPKEPFVVAVAAGSGAALLDDAYAQGARVLLTGEASHHDALRAARMGMALVATLHSNIERPSLHALAAGLKAELSIPVITSRVDADPYRFA